jgi:hypothetical protein
MDLDIDIDEENGGLYITHYGPNPIKVRVTATDAKGLRWEETVVAPPNVLTSLTSLGPHPGIRAGEDEPTR